MAGQVFSGLWEPFAKGAFRAGNCQVKSVVNAEFIGAIKDLLFMPAQRAELIAVQKSLQLDRPKVFRPSRGRQGKENQAEGQILVYTH